MDLFEEAARPPQLGFRLARLEVYNWGTFDGEVWSLAPEGATSLLTGDVGSGKSTLVDAIITLLVPPRRITYNKAADASAKERSLSSYVRGYYAHHSTAEGTSRPEALRDKREYSVILGVFIDENFGRSVTLAQVFWYKSESAATPSRLYVLAEKPLSIAERFSRLGGDMRAFRKRLEADDFIHTYDDYPLYGRDFRKLFGIRQEQALDLFQQTISLKKVDSLTEFVRANMLETPDVEGLLAGLLHQFRDLEAAHASVVRAREQQQLLVPVRETGARYRRLRSERETYERMGEVLPAWLARRDIAALAAQAEAAEQQRQTLSGEIAALADERRAAERRLAAVRAGLAQQGGARLAALEGQLAALEEKQEARRAAAARYEESAAVLGLAVPETAAAFAANRAQAQA
ncbi:MAG: ATP-binding protein, partial [Selenomonadaceae bacterium]|nr:ATP-binding protein [Selenomonadaceae bacterium]